MFGGPRVIVIQSIGAGGTRELRRIWCISIRCSWARTRARVRDRRIDPKGRNGVFRIDARTGDVTLIVQLPFGFERAFPQWSPSGKHIDTSPSAEGRRHRWRRRVHRARSRDRRRAGTRPWQPTEASACPRTAVGSPLRSPRSIDAVPGNRAHPDCGGRDARSVPRNCSRKHRRAVLRPALDARQPWPHRAEAPRTQQHGVVAGAVCGRAASQAGCGRQPVGDGKSRPDYPQSRRAADRVPEGERFTRCGCWRNLPAQTPKR